MNHILVSVSITIVMVVALSELIGEIFKYINATALHRANKNVRSRWEGYVDRALTILNDPMNIIHAPGDFDNEDPHTIALMTSIMAASMSGADPEDAAAEYIVDHDEQVKKIYADAMAFESILSKVRITYRVCAVLVTILYFIPWK
jgi:hypothetical protein